uniref:Meg domain-containing protein n=1 Tax=Leersia perrieri TaxID=77586 RepID=A0A0D9WWN3_9ORYZ
MAKHTFQGLLLVLLVCSAIPAMIRGETTDAMGRNATIKADIKDCIHNPISPHPADKIFCCVKDNECWASIQDCLANCPCVTNC